MRVVTVTRMGWRRGADAKFHTSLPEVVDAGVVALCALPELPDGGAGFVAHKRGEAAREFAAGAGGQLAPRNARAAVHTETARVTSFFAPFPALGSHIVRTAISALPRTRAPQSE
ncbi:hypothetical protein [Streptomyces sp. BRA346]|uniref:hypothetical protein n=1 Tax=Streptomyces sp. BRA346 TaxID=2878199 RepID=UPI0040632F62